MKGPRKFVIYGMVVFALVFGITGLASATLEINLVDGDWQNWQFDGLYSNHTVNNSGTSGGTSTIYWGYGASQSGYNFTSVGTPFDAAVDGTVFALGTFIHENQPIYGSSLTSIDLLTNLGITGLSSFNVTFNFEHDETPNTGNPGQSRDIVSILNPIVNKDFTSGGYTYYFNLIGFSQDGGQTITSQFKTWEGQTNTATLYAKITSSPISTPEPGTLILFGIGLMSLRVVLRKKRCKI